MSKSFCLLDDSMTLHGLRFKPEGADMSRFRENPILLYMHIRGTVHGKWNNIRLEDGKWLADPEFDLEDPESAKIAGKVERGFLKACSMGVYPLAVEIIDGEPWAVKWLALETSIVDAGSNGNSLRLCAETGETIEDIESHILKLTVPIMADEKKNAGAIVAVPKEIALAAGLAEDATADSIVEAIKTASSKYLEQVQKVKDLELAAKTKETAAIKELLDSAVSDKKIAATERTHYEELAAVNFDAVKAIVSKIPAPVDLVGLAKTGKESDADSEDLAAEYDKLDKAGKLTNLQASNPVKFNSLYKARWNKEYKA